VASLKKSSEAHTGPKPPNAASGMQRDRQKVAVERSQANTEKLSVKAPIKGMVALQNVWRNNSLGHAQVGDQVWPGTPLLQLFDPSEMEVELAVESRMEPHWYGRKGGVHLDAFPELSFTAISNPPVP